MDFHGHTSLEPTPGLTFTGDHLTHLVLIFEYAMDGSALWNTGGIEKFSAKENFRKILNISHFYSGFSLKKNHNEIKHSQKVSLDFLDSNLETLIKPYVIQKTLMKIF